MNRYCLLSLWTKVATTQKTNDLFRVGPKQRSLQLLKFEHFYWLCKPASYLKGGCPCIGRELDPDLPRGRRKFYHWTTNALQLLLVQVHASLIGLQELKRSLFGPSVTQQSQAQSRQCNLFSHAPFWEDVEKKNDLLMLINDLLMHCPRKACGVPVK